MKKQRNLFSSKILKDAKNKLKDTTKDIINDIEKFNLEDKKKKQTLFPKEDHVIYRNDTAWISLNDFNVIDENTSQEVDENTDSNTYSTITTPDPEASDKEPMEEYKKSNVTIVAYDNEVENNEIDKENDDDKSVFHFFKGPTDTTKNEEDAVEVDTNNDDVNFFSDNTTSIYNDNEEKDEEVIEDTYDDQEEENDNNEGNANNEDDETDEVTNNDAELFNTTSKPIEENKIGGDLDSNGCIPSAGYKWCDVLNECVRPWEKKCEPTEELTSIPINTIANQSISENIQFDNSTISEETESSTSTPTSTKQETSSPTAAPIIQYITNSPTNATLVITSSPTEAPQFRTIIPKRTNTPTQQPQLTDSPTSQEKHLRTNAPTTNNDDFYIPKTSIPDIQQITDPYKTTYTITPTTKFKKHIAKTTQAVNPDDDEGYFEDGNNVQLLGAAVIMFVIVCVILCIKRSMGRRRQNNTYRGYNRAGRDQFSDEGMYTFSSKGD